MARDLPHGLSGTLCSCSMEQKLAPNSQRFFADNRNCSIICLFYRAENNPDLWNIFHPPKERFETGRRKAR